MAKRSCDAASCATLMATYAGSTQATEGDMEQGPEEISDQPDERADDLSNATERPLNEQGSGDRADMGEGAEDTDKIDPGL